MPCRERRFEERECDWLSAVLVCYFRWRKQNVKSRAWVFRGSPWVQADLGCQASPWGSHSSPLMPDGLGDTETHRDNIKHVAMETFTQINTIHFIYATAYSVCLLSYLNHDVDLYVTDYKIDCDRNTKKAIVYSPCYRPVWKTESQRKKTH